jgi:hypothetical protein
MTPHRNPLSRRTPHRNRLSRAELEAEVGTLLPEKEVISLLDLRIDVDLALALAAPIDLAVAANANVAAPIDAAVSANILSFFSDAGAVANQYVEIGQYISGEAIATADQGAVIEQGGSGDGGEVQAMLEPGDDSVTLLEATDTNGNGDLDLSALDTADVGETITTLEGTISELEGLLAGLAADDPLHGELLGLIGELEGVIGLLEAGDLDAALALLDPLLSEVEGVLGELLDLGLLDGELIESLLGELDGVVATLTDLLESVGDILDPIVDDVVSPIISALDGALADGLLKLDVKIALDADLAAPIAGAVAANANVALPIDAAVAANVGSVGSEAIAIADQTAIITQVLDDVKAEATAIQDAEISQ